VGYQLASIFAGALAPIIALELLGSTGEEHTRSRSTSASPARPSSAVLPQGDLRLAAPRRVVRTRTCNDPTHGGPRRDPAALRVRGASSTPARGVGRPRWYARPGMPDAETQNAPSRPPVRSGTSATARTWPRTAPRLLPGRPPARRLPPTPVPDPAHPAAASAWTSPAPCTSPATRRSGAAASPSTTTRRPAPRRPAPIW
jgi:hypothetical protein